MRRICRVLPSLLPLSLLAGALSPAHCQRSYPLRMPLPEHDVQMLADVVSGQAAFNNMVKLAGAPWMRTADELTGATNFYESDELVRMVRAYGIETVRLDRYPAPGTFSYALEGELWIEDGSAMAGIRTPARNPANPRRVAWLEADPALIARGSQTHQVRGPLFYVPQLSPEDVPAFQEELAAHPGRYRGGVALMWSHPRGELFQALDRAGVEAVISFNARERYLDPDQVVYARGGYAEGENLKLGFTVSWRQWSELLEDVERGVVLTVRGRAVVEEYPDRFETVYAWIPGTEPEERGVVFTAHLFEGYTKRGANDNMGGPAIQLEILRTLDHLIRTGHLERPRRTIHFIWPQEISGTYEFLRRDPTLAERLSININMDMVSEALRKNNSVFTMSETPTHLASYFDGLAHAVLNYVWRTNDIVYLPDSPRGRPGGQYFPRPMWEKNGTKDAFRFFIHEATGGSDHLVFNNPSVAVPGIEFFTWPDQWYHADKDLPENGDPTEMKRVAFIGAATAWVSANLADDQVGHLLDAVGDFGYRRLAERGIPRALEALDQEVSRTGLDGVPLEVDADRAFERAWLILDGALKREMDAVASIREIHSGSPQAASLVEARLREWEAYGEGLREYLLTAAEARGVEGAAFPAPSSAEVAARRVTPRLAPGIRSVETSLNRYGRMQAYLEAHPDAVAELGLSNGQTRQILNFINGERSVTEILLRVRGLTGEEMTLEQLQGYLDILEEVGWITL